LFAHQVQLTAGGGLFYLKGKQCLLLGDPNPKSKLWFNEKELIKQQEAQKVTKKFDKKSDSEDDTKQAKVDEIVKLAYRGSLDLFNRAVLQIKCDAEVYHFMMMFVHANYKEYNPNEVRLIDEDEYDEKCGGFVYWPNNSDVRGGEWHQTTKSYKFYDIVSTDTTNFRVGEKIRGYVSCIVCDEKDRKEMIIPSFYCSAEIKKRNRHVGVLSYVRVQQMIAKANTPKPAGGKKAEKDQKNRKVSCRFYSLYQRLGGSFVV